MQSPSDKAAEHLLQKYVLPLFSLPDSNVIWQGASELNMQSFVYYFCINSVNYLLVNEPYHGVSNNTLLESLIGNAVAPHQRAIPILPKEGTHAYVTVSHKSSDAGVQITGDFSVFRILD